MTTMGPPPPDGDYVPPKTDDPYGLKHLAKTEQRKAETLARYAEQDRHNTEGSP